MFNRLRGPLEADLRAAQLRSEQADNARATAQAEVAGLLAQLPDLERRHEHAAAAKETADAALAVAREQLAHAEAELAQAQEGYERIQAALEAHADARPDSSDFVAVKEWEAEGRRLRQAATAAGKEVGAAKTARDGAAPRAERALEDQQSALDAWDTARNALRRVTDAVPGAQQRLEQAATDVDAATAVVTRLRAQIDDFDARQRTVLTEPLDRVTVQAAADRELADLLGHQHARHALLGRLLAATGRRGEVLTAQDVVVDELEHLAREIAGWSDFATWPALRQVVTAVEALVAESAAARQLPAAERRGDPASAAQLVTQQAELVAQILVAVTTVRDTARAEMDAAHARLRDHQLPRGSTAPGRWRPDDFIGDDPDEAQRYLDALAEWAEARDRLTNAHEQARGRFERAEQRAGELTAWRDRLALASQHATDHGRQLAEVDDAVAQLRRQAAAAQDAVDDHAEARATATARLLDLRSVRSPIVLAPVRLESAWEGRTLRLRIFPDSLMLESHDDLLTADEVNAAAAYWRTRDADPDDDANQAWSQLVARYGAPRAAHVVVSTRPGGAAPKSRSWDAPAPRVALLPDRFAVVAFHAGEPVNLGSDGRPQYVTWGAPVSEQVVWATLGPGEASSWITDLDMAIAAGLAMRIPVPADAPAIDLLVVVGIRGPEVDLGALLLGHARTVGLEVLPDGGPTSNAPGQRACFGPAHDAEVAKSLLGPDLPVGVGSAGRQIADLLGIDPSAMARVFGADADRSAVTDAVKVLVALGTTGTVHEALGPTGVAAWPLLAPAGPSPVIRLGRQPYGVLPTTARSRWRPEAGETTGGLTELLQAWGRVAGPSSALDPAAPPLLPGGGGAPRVLDPADPVGTADLLAECPASVAWRSPDGAMWEAVGQGTEHYLQVVAQTPVADLVRIAPGLPRTMLAAVAVAAKQRSAAAGRATDVDASLVALAHVPAGDLARCLGGLLDSASHRLDPWLTAPCTERLLQLRSDSTGPVAVGAYGWLTDVAPRDDEPVSYGHVLAPSLSHAVTAAVLRAGFLGERRRAWDARVSVAAQAVTDARATGDDRAVRDAEHALVEAREGRRRLTPLEPDVEVRLRLGIDVSSRAIRDALEVLDAVAADQPLATVLGRKFERELVDSGLSAYLGDFRRLTRVRTGSELEQREATRAEADRGVRQQLAKLRALTEVAARRDDDREHALTGVATATARYEAAEEAVRAAGIPELQAELDHLTARVARLEAEVAELDATRREPVVRPVRTRIPSIDPGTGAVVVEDQDVEYVDVHDAPGVEQWSGARALKAAELDEARRASDRLRRRLESPATTTKLTDVITRRGELDDAMRVLDDARRAADVARDDVERHRLGPLADAIALQAAAVRAVSDHLAELLATSATSTTLSATVDGVSLRARYRLAKAAVPATWNHATIPFPDAPRPTDPDTGLHLPALGTDDHRRLLQVLDRLDQRLDAVSDVLTAESVHQLAAGNVARAGAAAEVATGGRVPDELAVVRTPVRGENVAHRVVVLFDAPAAPAWASARPGIAADLDPALASWLSRLLPDPAMLTMTVRGVDPAGDVEEQRHSLATLGLDPLEWIRLARNTGELTERLHHAARFGSGWHDRTVTVDGGKDLEDMLAAASAAHRLLDRARALSGSDLAQPGTEPPAKHPTTDVRRRIQAATTRLAALADHLEQAAVANPADSRRLIGLLFEASAAGVAGATPPLAEPARLTDQLLQEHAVRAATKLRDRVATDDGPEPSDAQSAWMHLRRRVERLAGTRILLVDPVQLPPQVREDLSDTGDRLPGADPGTIRTWLNAHARVRPALEALAGAYAVAETLGATARLQLLATHLPRVEDSPWVGAAAPPGPGAVSLVVQRDLGSQPPHEAFGLTVDTWVETAPAGTHQAGLTFHADQPGARPPQTLLVAVAPDLHPAGRSAYWDLDSLVETLTDTVMLARDRVVASERRADAVLTVLDVQ